MCDRSWVAVAYTIGEQPVLISFSVVAGPSFNDLDFDDDFLNSLPQGPRPDLDAKNSFAVRPGVGLTWTVAERVAIIGFGGYMFNRPDVVYHDVDGTGIPQPLEGGLDPAQRRRGLLALLRPPA